MRSWNVHCRTRHVRRVRTQVVRVKRCRGVVYACVLSKKKGGEKREERGEEGGEGEQRVVANFYAFVPVSEPVNEVEIQREFLRERDIKGRIYICEYGINAQLSGSRAETTEYCVWSAARLHFSASRCSYWPLLNGEAHAFPRLRVANRELVQLPVDETSNAASSSTPQAGAPSMTDLLLQPDDEAGARALSPAEWKQAMADVSSSSSAGVVLDVRNDYEYDAGHFDAARRPSCTIFRDTETEEDALENVPKDAPIYMYCTGGIRCDAYSRVLRQKGYSNLNTLKGGVQNYLKEQHVEADSDEAEGQEGTASLHWTGSLYVFDERGSIACGSDAESEMELRSSLLDANGQADNSSEEVDEEQVIRCIHCGKPVDVFPPSRNCANVDCNSLFLSCQECAQKMNGCCSDACTSAPRLRPLLAPGETYRRWGSYMRDDQRPPPGQGKNRRNRRKQKEKRRQRQEQDATHMSLSSPRSHAAVSAHSSSSTATTAAATTSHSKVR